MRLTTQPVRSRSGHPAWVSRPPLQCSFQGAMPSASPKVSEPHYIPRQLVLPQFHHVAEPPGGEQNPPAYGLCVSTLATVPTSPSSPLLPSSLQSGFPTTLPSAGPLRNAAAQSLLSWRCHLLWQWRLMGPCPLGVRSIGQTLLFLALISAGSPPDQSRKPTP